MADMDPRTVLVIDYTNHDGIRAMRRIVPLKVWYGVSEYHPAQVERSWFLQAIDVERAEMFKDTDIAQATRDFLMTAIHEIMSLDMFFVRAERDKRWQAQQTEWVKAQGR